MSSRTAVVDLGSNTFRTVVFEYAKDRWWRHAAELSDRVRIGEGEEATGRLGDVPIARAIDALDTYRRFCRALEVDDVHPVATSAIRDAENRDAFVRRASAALGRPVRVLTADEEARYGYLAAVNSTTLCDGAVVDLGGGSAQVVEVEGREARGARSWPLGAVRMTERFLGEGPARKRELRALRRHAGDALRGAVWLRDAARIVALGGTVRTLAAAAQRATGDPAWGVHGFLLGAEALDELIGELAARPAAERDEVPGIKGARADVVLAGAVVLAAVLEASGAAGLEVAEPGLREGVFLERFLSGRGPLVAHVRMASTLNLARRFGADTRYDRHVAELALALWDGLAAAGIHPGDAAERELLGTAARLRSIGRVIDHDDHHRHSRHLVLTAGLPGFTPREVGLIAQTVRYHRKGTPSLEEAKALAEPEDARLLRRCVVCLRLSEELDRARDGAVRRVTVRGDANGRLELVADGDGESARRALERLAEPLAATLGTRLVCA